MSKGTFTLDATQRDAKVGNLRESFAQNRPTIQKQCFAGVKKQQLAKFATG